jgi:uncharacterized repeat protein (TIGR03803 family)
MLAARRSITLALPALLLLGTSTAVSAQGFRVLYTFHGSDGGLPQTQLTLDSEGNIYGTTSGGGANTCAGDGCGTVFVVSPNGKLLRSYSFNGSDGATPLAGVVRDSAGNLFGTTSGGGNYSEACGGTTGGGCGVVYRLTPSGKETVHRFNGSPGPWFPESLLVQDESGNLYGTSLWGGTRNNGGTAFMISPTGEESQLFNFPSRSNPAAGMILLNGILYGTTVGSGHYGSSFFQMTTTGEATDIGGIPGTPESLLAADSTGILYGTTEYGGSANSGTVYKLSPNSFGGWTYSELYSFCQLRNCADGQRPMGGPLVIDSAGNIFGTTIFGGSSQNCNGGSCGVVFKLDPSGNETVIHNFTGGADGSSPSAGLTMDSAGSLYGTALTGGDLACPISSPQGCGVVFKIIP